jgi:hypothetical protein
MYPHERSLVKELANQPFALIGVNSDKDKAELKQAMEKEHITWRSFIDGGTAGPIAKAWEVKAWPTIYVIDQNCIIRAENLRGEQLTAAVLLLLKQPKKEIARKPADKSSGEKTVLTAKQDSKPPPSDKETLEKRAASLFSLAKSLADAGKTDKARTRLEDIIKKYPDTLAAADAKELLDMIAK